MVRASSSRVGGHGFNPMPIITKMLKMVPVAALLDKQYYKANTGSSLSYGDECSF